MTAAVPDAVCPSPCLVEALDYASRGWPVLPLRGKVPRTSHGLHDATTDPDRIRAWWARWPDAGVGIATGGAAGGLVVIDVDPRHGGDDSLEALRQRGVDLLRLPTPIVQTGGGGWHVYLRAPDGVAIRSRTGVLPGIDVRSEGGYVVAPPSPHESGRDYVWELESGPDVPPIEVPPSLLALLADEPSPPSGARTVEQEIRDSTRNTTLARIAGAMRRHGACQQAIDAALVADNAIRCRPPLDEREVRRIAQSVSRYAPEAADSREWPAPLSDDALVGLAGEIVRAIEPHTEADPVALLAQLLAAAGCMIGSRPHVRIGATYHPARLYVAVVGATAQARKGTSWQEVLRVLREADPEWVRDRVPSGILSSGEGVIEALRERDGQLPDGRLLCMVPELASVLATQRRDGSVLSAVVRDLWDRGDVAVVRRGDPARITGAHLGLIGHVTRDELEARLDPVDLLSGWGNRILWLAVRRQRELPFGGELGDDVVAMLARRLCAAVDQARQRGVVPIATAARDTWAALYSELGTDRPGLLGAATARAQPLTLRLALTYALLDGAAAIGESHLRAAAAIWRYAAETAAWLWGASTGSRLADRLLAALRRAGADGLTRSELHAALGRNAAAKEIARALDTLASAGLAECIAARGQSSPERWRSITPGDSP